jgi:uncharacterized membrane protein
MKLTKNMGTTDRMIRIALAVIFAILYFTGIVSGVLGIVLLVLAAVFALTAALKFCPLYLPFNISTAKN